ncbi:MAG: YfbR-like 5'-deoxynucleotidase [Spirochaetota bacterium]
MAVVITRDLASRLFQGFSIQRWTDRPKPVDLTEMDHAAYQMVVAFLVGTLEEERGAAINWYTVIKAGIFRLLRKLALSDIKAPVHHTIREKYPEVYRQINEWVYQSLGPLLPENRLRDEFHDYLLPTGSLSEDHVYGYRLAEAAHSYATYAELQQVKLLHTADPDLYEIEKQLSGDLEHFLDFPGIRQLVMKQELYELMEVIDRLRYQTRWSQTPRIPSTSVLGHSMFVAVISLFLSVHVDAVPRRIFNNFFGGLFHDLPESVTRDIVAPTKRATPELPDVIKRIEQEIVNQELYPLMSEQTRVLIRYFCEREFESRVIIDGTEQGTTTAEISERYNDDACNPIDGEIIRLADDMAAFLEAYQSIQYGIRSEVLYRGARRIKGEYLAGIGPDGIDVVEFFRQFPIEGETS